MVSGTPPPIVARIALSTVAKAKVYKLELPADREQHSSQRTMAVNKNWNGQRAHEQVGSGRGDYRRQNAPRDVLTVELIPTGGAAFSR